MTTHWSQKKEGTFDLSENLLKDYIEQQNSEIKDSINLNTDSEIILKSDVDNLKLLLQEISNEKRKFTEERINFN